MPVTESRVAAPRPATPNPQVGRDERGRFGPGNAIGRATQFRPGDLHALTHGLRAANLPPEFAHLAGEVEAFVQGSLIDDGVECEVPTRRRALHEYR